MWGQPPFDFAQGTLSAVRPGRSPACASIRASRLDVLRLFPLKPRIICPVFCSVRPRKPVIRPRATIQSDETMSIVLIAMRSFQVAPVSGHSRSFTLKPQGGSSMRPSNPFRFVLALSLALSVAGCTACNKA